MTRPALRPLTLATAAVVAGAAGVVPATALGALSAPAGAERSSAPHPHPALSPPLATPVEVGATVARGPGALPAGLAASSATVAGDGFTRWENGTGPSTGGRSAVGVVRARGPPR
jgi:hypothetical protein